MFSVLEDVEAVPGSLLSAFILNSVCSWFEHTVQAMSKVCSEMFRDVQVCTNERAIVYLALPTRALLGTGVEFAFHSSSNLPERASRATNCTALRLFWPASTPKGKAPYIPISLLHICPYLLLNPRSESFLFGFTFVKSRSNVSLRSAGRRESERYFWLRICLRGIISKDYSFPGNCFIGAFSQSERNGEAR